MKKWIILLVVALLLGYIGAGPFLTVNAIRDAVKTQDSAGLSRHVDFIALRANLKAQFDDYVVRRAGPDIQSNPFGAFATRVVSGVAAGSVDAMVTPAGLGAMLQGRALWHRASGSDFGSDAYAHVPPPDPLKDATYAFESLSRFTATVHNEAGEPVAFVLTREGLRWKLSDIRLPLAPETGRRTPR